MKNYLLVYVLNGNQQYIAVDSIIRGADILEFITEVLNCRCEVYSRIYDENEKCMVYQFLLSKEV